MRMIKPPYRLGLNVNKTSIVSGFSCKSNLWWGVQELVLCRCINKTIQSLNQWWVDDMDQDGDMPKFHLMLLASTETFKPAGWWPLVWSILWLVTSPNRTSEDHTGICTCIYIYYVYILCIYIIYISYIYILYIYIYIILYIYIYIIFINIESHHIIS